MRPLKSLLQIAAVCASAGLSSCANPPAPPPALETTPTIAGKSSAPPPPGGPLVIGPGASRVKVAAGPRPPVTVLPATPAGANPPPPVSGSGSGESLSLEQVPLPTFVNEVFAKTLKLSVQIDPAVMSRNDLVTLRTGGPLSGQELFALAQSVLADYGLAASWDGRVLHIVTDQQLMAAMPEVIRGRAVPQLPTALRPIFQVVDLHQVSASDMMQWLTSAYGQNVRVIASPSTSSIMLFGLPQNVEAAVEAVQVLDQARMAGRGSLRVSPVYWTARDLAVKLVQLLRAEGYDASAAVSTAALTAAAAPEGTITVVPVETNNSLIVFTADPKILAHVRQWIESLDRPGLVDPAHDIFVYFVQNTTAASIGATVQAVLSGGAAPVSAPAEAQLEQAGRTQPATGPGPSGIGLSAAGGGGPGLATAQLPPPAPTPQAAIEPLSTTPPPGGAARGPAGPRVVVDAPRNALIIIGSAQDYERVRPLLQALDKAPREALIEVTVAEVDLNDANNLGIEWTAVAPFGATRTQAFGTGGNVLTPPLPGGIGGGSVNGVGLSPLGTSGFNYTILSNLGDVYAILNAFAQNNGLSVLSTPRVLAESGQAANIEVGSQVPIITGQTTTNVAQSGGTSGILQSIQYTQTGVLLSVRPVIHSGNRIDLTISQEVSQPLQNNTPGITSPIIQNRNVSTQLSLNDGQTVVIGGMIAENRTDSENGIPYLKDIPGLGILFRSQMLSKTRTELLVFITPYVISNDSDAAAITRQFQEQMSKWTVPRTQLHW